MIIIITIIIIIIIIINVITTHGPSAVPPLQPMDWPAIAFFAYSSSAQPRKRMLQSCYFNCGTEIITCETSGIIVDDH